MNANFSLRFLALLIVALNGAWAEDFEVSHSIDWMRADLNTKISFNLAEADIRLPGGRFMGEEILSRAYPELLRSTILPIRADSDSTIYDLLDRREISMEELDSLSLEAEKTPPSLSTDLTRMIGSYRMLMESLSALLTLHRGAIEPARPLIPVPAADYTGIIIIADEELPIHGRRSQSYAEPCLFPKIWDTNMDLIYEKNMFNPSGPQALIARYTVRDSIFRPTPSGLEGELASFVGPNPLRILAREVFGVNPTDLVIDRDDAMKILSTDNNRRLLREGRLLLVLNEKMLKSAF